MHDPMVSLNVLFYLKVIILFAINKIAYQNTQQILHGF